MAGPASRVSRVVMTGPLAPFAGVYELELRRRRYTPLTVVNQLRQVARLSHWLKTNGLAVAELTGDRVEEFLALQRASGRYRAQWSSPGLLCLLDVLRGLGVVAVAERARAGSPAEVVLASFERYLLAERALATGTVRGYVSHARRFLDGLPCGGELAGVMAADVIGAVLRESAAVSVSATQFFVAGLRSFLRFCFIEGLVEADLSQAALPVTGRRRSSLPKGITKPDANALLACCDRRSTVGRRDYALITTVLRLGLRVSEVAGLRLDDIDWRAGELVVRGKGARSDRLPLPADVGRSIASYLQRGRPSGNRREVFLRARAPFGPIAPGTVSSTVRRACRRAGVAEVGAHRLRHTVAGEMVSAGVPWCRSRRCCGITACRARRFTPAWTSTSCGCWLRRGQKVRSDERAERTRRGLPAVAPGAGVQAGARRATAPTTGGLPRGGGGSHDHQRARDRVGAPAGKGTTQPLGAATRHRPRICPLPADDRPGDRGATARCVPVAPPPPGPYLWSASGICRLLQEARALRPPLRAATHETLFGLFAASGMRLGEAIGLQRDDVDLVAGVLMIREAKFDRSRLVPLHPTTTEALRRYAAERDRLCPRPRSGAFFLSSVGTTLTRSGVDKTFRQITIAIGVRTATVRPRVHDLRHSFAVDTLIRWYRSGVNLDAHIGVLSTYLGHVSPADTYWYLSAAPELMALAADRLHSRFGAQR